MEAASVDAADGLAADMIGSKDVVPLQDASKVAADNKEVVVTNPTRDITNKILITGRMITLRKLISITKDYLLHRLVQVVHPITKTQLDGAETKRTVTCPS